LFTLAAKIQKNPYKGKMKTKIFIFVKLIVPLDKVLRHGNKTKNKLFICISHNLIVPLQTILKI